MKNIRLRRFYMKKVVALILTFIFIASSMTVLLGCSGDSGTLKEIPLSDRENPVIGKVGDYEIRLDEWDFLYNSYYLQYVNMYGKEAAEQDEGKKEISDKTCAALKINAAALSVAAEYGITPENEKVKEYVAKKLEELASELTDEISAGLEGDDETASNEDINELYKKYLAESRLTDRYNRFVFAVDGCINQTVEKCLAEGKLLTEETAVIDYIKNNFVRVWTVKLTVGGESDREQKREEAELLEWIMKTDFTVSENCDLFKEKLGITVATESNKNLRSFYNRIVSADSAQAKMKVLIGSKYNSDNYMTTLHGYYFTYGEYFEEFEKAAFDLDEGEASGIVASGDAYYIIMRLALEGDYINEAYDTLNYQYQYSYVNRMIDSRKAELSFTPDGTVLIPGYIG